MANAFVVRNKITGEYKNINQYYRPNWQDYLLGLAKVVSKRSHDIQTQHGCIITDRDNRILGTGYNGFPRGLDDSTLPNTRPDKYDWMLHSEVNAISNCVVRPENGVAYITGEPCNQCLMFMWQSGIKKIVCGSKYSWQKSNEQTKKVFDKFVEQSKINITYVEPNLTWITNLADEIKIK